ncbi:RNA polymerase sigma-70 factor, ECF subfamily [Fodinibius roseus]|uniref:RNA polymerase sigma-70 factor, ECF subfamily n=1 Tax=Fodinibius roseus TaxID=1194090 RepID=A0A1M5F0C7_9BACT|nr:RNA polymerase sigma-70 factor [Fodinibius roseus]SHF84671.1 RNA polymerase sigma-70 factor, ECF subfamily [Fodinibius roseus]
MKKGVKLWVKKIKGGDRKAFEKLFLRFYEPLCQFSWQFTRSRHVSEELVQEVFLAVWKSRETLDSKKDVRSYLYQSVRNKALNHIKHQELAEEYNSKIEWLSPTPVTQTHHYGEQSEFEKAAKKAIENLPDRARQVYKLSRKDGLTYREISDVLDISVKTVESQMSRALKKLRNSLSQYL